MILEEYPNGEQVLFKAQSLRRAQKWGHQVLWNVDVWHGAENRDWLNIDIKSF